jgi:two-component system LytT family response regulator
MMRVAVIDDEPLARLAVTARLAHRADFDVVAEYGDSASAASGLLALRPDLVFVDINMPGTSGLAMLAALPPSARPMAILLTAYDNFAVQAFALDVLDYLLKPVDDERFDEALERAVRAFPYRRQDVIVTAAQPLLRTFAARVGTRTVLVNAADVERIESDGDYATLHAGGKTYLVRERLALLAERLDPQQFQRVHRSCIVRLDMVSELRALTNRDALLRLRDGSLLRASRTYTPALMAAIAGRTPATTS